MRISHGQLGALHPVGPAIGPEHSCFAVGSCAPCLSIARVHRDVLETGSLGPNFGMHPEDDMSVCMSPVSVVSVVEVLGAERYCDVPTRPRMYEWCGTAYFTLDKVMVVWSGIYGLVILVVFCCQPDAASGSKKPASNNPAQHQCTLQTIVSIPPGSVARSPVPV